VARHPLKKKKRGKKKKEGTVSLGFPLIIIAGWGERRMLLSISCLEKKRGGRERTAALTIFYFLVGEKKGKGVP